MGFMSTSRVQMIEGTNPIRDVAIVESSENKEKIQIDYAMNEGLQIIFSGFYLYTYFKEPFKK